MSKLSIGIVGLPNAGKSTLFNTLTDKAVPAENFPFCTIDPSVGVVAVPDERLDQLSKFSASKSTIPVVIEFVDIAGLVRGASEGEGLGNEFLSHIREVDAIAQTVRAFSDETIIHTEGGVDPIRDIEIITTELILKDLQSIESRQNSIKRDLKSGDKEAVEENNFLQESLRFLEKGIPLRRNDNEDAKAFYRRMGLLSAKPVLFVLNTSVLDGNKENIIKYLIDNDEKYIEFDVKTEGEIRALGDGAETLREEFAITKDGLDTFIKESFSLLSLISFFTTGEKETRGWAVKKDSYAPIAGMAIHSDFCKNFIRADVIAWQDLIAAESYANARANGTIRMEGKKYVVTDGDVIEFFV